MKRGDEQQRKMGLDGIMHKMLPSRMTSRTTISTHARTATPSLRPQRCHSTIDAQPAMELSSRKAIVARTPTQGNQPQLLRQKPRHRTIAARSPPDRRRRTARDINELKQYMEQIITQHRCHFSNNKSNGV